MLKKKRKKKNRNDKIIPVKIGAVFVDDFHFSSSLLRLDPQKGVVTLLCTAVYLSDVFLILPQRVAKVRHLQSKHGGFNGI